MDSLTPDAKSQTHFHCYLENSFQVLSDHATFIRIKSDQSSKHSVLVKELICQKKPSKQVPVVEFGRHLKQINSVLVMQQHKCIFAGDDKNTVIQYKLSRVDETPKVVKIYKNIGIGRICSLLSIAKFAMFGGNDNQIAFIAPDSQEVITKSVKVAIEYIYSMSLCQIRESEKQVQVVLAVSGDGADYSTGQSDLLDLTACLDVLGISEQDLQKAQSKKNMQNRSEEKTVGQDSSRKVNYRLQVQKL